MVSRVCQEFGCLPSAAVRALEDDPDHLIIKILYMRSFANAKQVYDSAKSRADIPASRMMDTLIDIEYEVTQEEMEAISE